MNIHKGADKKTRKNVIKTMNINFNARSASNIFNYIFAT